MLCTFELSDLTSNGSNLISTTNNREPFIDERDPSHQMHDLTTRRSAIQCCAYHCTTLSPNLCYYRSFEIKNDCGSKNNTPSVP
ncbi:hypothetical protein RHMOL_Rhmol09G0158100 [Rhododendron molle]|uniref:Uncharacterized protein n=1 Tax=Rhododendron molle TaxID=49168 RepID=A0ACC0MDU3_RHOML|nr:hypothetical protein RHMOL_Rhmol09G0158100 [Rhododendron molle]